MNAFETDQLAQWIRQKHRCLVQLHELGGRQLRLIDEGNMTDLLMVLSAKQQLITELDRIERKLDPFRPQKPDERRWRCEEDRARCARQIEQCESLFAEIVAQEKRGEQLLRRRRDEVSARLDTAQTAGHAHHAYTASDAPRANQLDLSSESGSSK
jgi:hypothetical protein